MVNTDGNADSISDAGICLQKQLRIQQIWSCQQYNKREYGHWLLAGENQVRDF